MLTGTGCVSDPHTRPGGDHVGQRATRQQAVDAGAGPLHRLPSPLLVKDDEYAKALRRCGIQLRAPRGIVIASARWHTVRPLRVTGSQWPQKLHDYGDYPKWLEAVKYPCPRAPLLASSVVDGLPCSRAPVLLEYDAGHWSDLRVRHAPSRT